MLEPYKANGKVKPPPLPIIENELEYVLQHEVRGTLFELLPHQVARLKVWT